MSEQTSMSRRELLVALAASLAFTAALVLFTDLRTYDHPDFADPADHQKYLYLATHDPFSLHLAPFGWRPLVPSLARLLPFQVQTSFLVITFFCLWLTGWLVYILAREFGFSPTLSGAGMALFFSMGWATKFNMHDFWLTDPGAFLFATLGIWCIVRKKDWVLAVLLMVGVTAKEAVVFVAPLRYSLRARRLIDWPVVRRTILIALPAVAVLAVLRISNPPLNDDPAYVASLPPGLFASEPFGDGLTYDLVDRLLWVVRYRIRTFDYHELYAYVAGGWGILATILPLFGGRRSLSLAIRFSPLLVLAYVQLLFATVDTPRLLVLAFPAMILLSLTGARGLAERLGTPEWRFVVPPVLLFLALLRTPFPTTLPISQQLVIVAVSFPFLLHADRWIRARRVRHAPPVGG